MHNRATKGGPSETFPVRVYYEDTDFSGVVYHASYLRFLERGRTEFLRSLGIHHRELSFAFAVRSMSLEFIRPALMDDKLLIDTNLTKIGGASLEMSQKIFRATTLLVTADVRIAVVQAGKAIRIPREILDSLKPFKQKTG